uniref:Uncharacterized protein n=1 Tax=Nicotiana tabacum TaxID=4097 RepID=A0A1S4AXV4_TOBAC|nr:PREDICTED: uncharacterized protein LOC107802497 [Nicotiana tabacum]
MGIDLLAKLGKHSIVHHSQRHFVSHYQQCRAYSARSMNTAATKVPKTHFLSFPTFLRKSVSSSECANTKMGYLAWYLGALESRPIITKSISSAIIYAVADVTSQVRMGKKSL